jgi:hypothetical protein
LRFDVPEQCDPNQWSVVATGVFNGVAYAAIRHIRLSWAGVSAYPQDIRLHIFDGAANLPTYVTDPAVPNSMLHGYPLYAWSSSATLPLPVYQAYTPILGVSGSKLYMTTPEGNVRFCGIGRPRVWNSRSADDIETLGAMYYAVNADTASPAVITIPEPYLDFTIGVTTAQFASVVVERLTTTGAWSKIATGNVTLSSTTPAWATVAQTQVTVAAGAIPSGNVWRVRALVVPAVSVVDGCNVNANLQNITADGTTTRYLTSFAWSALGPVFGGITSLNGVLFGANAPWDAVEDASGVTAIQFKSASGVGNGTVNFDTGLVYDATMFNALAAGGTAGVVVTANGTTLANPADYTLTNNAGLLRITLAVVRAGQSITVRFIPAAARVMVVDPTSWIVLPGRVKVEGTVTPVNGLLRSSLGASASAQYLGIDATTGGTFGALPPPTPQASYNLLQLTLFTGSATVTGQYTEALKVKYPKEANSAWYATRHTANILVNQGTGETGSINVIGQADAQRSITSIVAVKNRLAISDAQTTQLWVVDPDPTQNHYLDRMNYGSASQGGVLYGMPVLNTQRGIQIIPLAGLNFQGLDVSNIGEPLQYLAPLNLGAGIFWPRLGYYIAFANIPNPVAYADSVHLPSDSPLRTAGALNAFVFLSYSKESGTLAWSVCPVPGVDSVDPYGYLARDNRLYFTATAGTNPGTYYFDSNATAFVDDTTGAVVPLYATTHFVHAGTPNRNKRLLALAVAGSNTATFTPLMQPWKNNGVFDPGAVVNDLTHGMPRIGLTGTGPALSFNIQSTDPRGYELQTLVIDLLPLGR